MNGDDLVRAVDADLATLLDECIRGKENPRLIRLIQQVMRLTDVEGERAAAETEAAPAKPAQPAAVAQPPAKVTPCPPHVPDVFGTCTKCGLSGIKIASS